MADISAFPTFNPTDDGMVAGSFTFIAGAAIKAGQVVAFAATGVSKTVHPALKGTTGQVLGVALYGAASGAKVAVALVGSIVDCVNADDTTAIDAGGWVEANDNAIGGTVSEAVLTSATIASANINIIGIALEDIAGAGHGSVLIVPQVFAPGQAS
ncbi:MAG: hypothetical protein WC096_02675 [Sphaerochaetaceae bacterium]